MTQKVGKMLVTQARAREAFYYNPETGWITWKTVPKYRVGFIKQGDRAGYFASRGYRRITIECKDYSEHRFIWFWVTGENPQLEVDHKDGDPSNNRWENLRLATGVQNAANSRYRRTNKTGFRGVSVFELRSGEKRYSTDIFYKRKYIFLGTFSTPQQAHNCYKEAAQKLHGEFYCEDKTI